jgi:palmitoyltransferase ZDHHC2/15/20
MLLWSYFSVVLTDPGSVPLNWRSHLDEERGETSPLTGPEFASQPLQPGPLNNTGNPRVRYCRKCNHLKPPRCHHCSVCESIFNLEAEFMDFLKDVKRKNLVF